jgi:hypothetical protein
MKEKNSDLILIYLIHYTIFICAVVIMYGVCGGGGGGLFRGQISTCVSTFAIFFTVLKEEISTVSLNKLSVC